MKTVSVEVDGRGVALLKLDRADKRNALSAQMMDELCDAAESLQTDTAVRVVLLTGEGAIFCAGGDLGWMRAQMSADAATREREARRLAGMLGALDRLNKPVIGRIHGAAMGGGAGLACICDVAIGGDDVRIGLTEVRLGLIPATIGPYVLTRIGASAMRQVALSGRILDAEEALSLGFLTKVVAGADLDAAVEVEIANHLAAAPGAAGRAKALIRDLTPSPETDRSIAALIECWNDHEATEGTEAFFERRAPKWALRPD